MLPPGKNVKCSYDVLPGHGPNVSRPTAKQSANVLIRFMHRVYLGIISIIAEHKCGSTYRVSVLMYVLRSGRSGRIAHLTFRRTKKILNTNESVRN